MEGWLLRSGRIARLEALLAVYFRAIKVPMIIDAKTPNTMRVVMTDLEGVVLMLLFVDQEEEDAVGVEELEESKLFV
jgi:hypothetical protein